MAATISERVQKHRDGLRLAGLRPVKIWVPDTRNESFALECQRQSRSLQRARQTTASIAPLSEIFYGLNAEFSGARYLRASVGTAS